MHKISKTAIVPYSARQMFDLVNDINNYPQFLNWCKDSKILTQNDQAITAFIEVSKGPFKQKFTTKNKLYPNSKITMNLIDGPFKELAGTWEFISLNKSAVKIIFNLEFAFATKILDISLSPAFSHIAKTQLDAFVLRAKEVYG
jgi:ribosome-associated toxin RatA of RatAB toxin-antitoxin module